MFYIALLSFDKLAMLFYSFCWTFSLLRHLSLGRKKEIGLFSISIPSINHFIRRTNELFPMLYVACRTITSYNLQQNAVEKYETSLDAPRKAGIKQGFLSGLTTGATAGES